MYRFMTDRLCNRRDLGVGQRITTVPAGADVSSDLIILFFCLCILAGALVLTPAGPGAEQVRLGPLVLPALCTFKALTDLPCPGCGLVRSAVAVAQGDFAVGFAYHLLGPLTLAYVLLQASLRLAWLVVPGLRGCMPHAERVLNRAIVALGILFGLNWVRSLYLLMSG